MVSGPVDHLETPPHIMRHDRSTFELDTRNSNKPKLRIETVVDGKPAYQYVFCLSWGENHAHKPAFSLNITGAPSRPPVTSLGSLVTTNVKDLFDKIGINPARWF